MFVFLEIQQKFVSCTLLYLGFQIKQIVKVVSRPQPVASVVPEVMACNGRTRRLSPSKSGVRCLGAPHFGGDRNQDRLYSERPQRWICRR